MGSSEGAPTPKSVNSNAAGAGPSFGMGWNAPVATVPSIQTPKVQAPTVQTPNTSPSPGSLSGVPSGPVPGLENRGLNPATGYQPYTPRSISVGGEGAARIRAEAGTTIGTRHENQPVRPKPSTAIAERDNGSQPTGQPKGWTAPSEKSQPAVSPKEPVLNPYGYSSRPEETGRSVDKIAHKPLDQAHRPVSGAIRSTTTPRPARSAEDQAALQREADAVARVARYDDYYDHARRALQDGGEAAIPELREIARLHSLTVGKSDPQAARQFDAGINREIAAYRANAAERPSEAGPNTNEAYTPAKVGLGNPGEYNPERYQKRKDEDFPTAQARIAGAIAQDQEAAEKRRFAEGADFYATAQENAGVTIIRAPDQDPVMDFGDGVRLEGLDTTGTKRLAEAMAEDPSVAEDIRNVVEGKIDVHALEDRLIELYRLPESTQARYASRHNDPVLTRDLAQERDHLEGLYEIALAQEDGKSSQAISDLIVANFAPDPNADYREAADLILGFLPGFQQLEAAEGLQVNGTALKNALENGDMEAAAQAGIFSLLSVVELIPGGGKAGTLLKRSLGRAITSLPKTKAALFRRNLEFGSWMGKVSITGYRTTNEARRVGDMSDSVARFVQTKGFDPQDGSILIRDKEALHMFRDAKTGRDQAIPRDYAARLPEVLGKPEKVLWDNQDPGLLYVFDVPDLGKKGKVVVRVDMSEKFKLSGETGKSGRRRGNLVRTSGLVEAPNLLQGRYQEIPK